MLTQDQLEARASAIGGSDHAVLMGRSPWMTARELYHLKRGELEAPPGDPLLAFLGHGVEPILARWYELETGWKTRQHHSTARHRDLDWMIAHPDRLVAGPSRTDRRGLEFKMRLSSRDWGPSGTDEIPDEVMAQCQHYMEVTRRPLWDVVALFCDIGDVRHYTVPRDRTLADRLIAQGGDFIARVRAGNPPDLDYEHRTALGLIHALHPGTDGRVVQLPPEAEHWHAVMQDARRERDQFDRVVTAARARLEHWMGDAAVGLMPDGSGYFRKQVTRGGYEVAPTTYIDFRHKKGPRT